MSAEPGGILGGHEHRFGGDTPEPRRRVTMKRLVILERAAWGVGLLLIVVFTIAKLHGVLSSRSELARFAAARSTAHQQATQPGSGPPTPLPVPTGVDFTLWSEGRVCAYQESQNEEGRQPHALAVLEIPRLGLKAPVLEGTDEITLNRGVGYVEDTALPGERGNVGIAGHRDGFFRVLKDVTRGDMIRLVTLAETLDYTVEDIRVVGPEDVQVLAPTSTPVLTLVTCYPFYYVGNAPQRYIVRAGLTSEGH
jgi:sortase A